MQKCLTFLLIGAVLCLSSCVSKSQSRRSQSRPTHVARVSNLWEGSSSRHQLTQVSGAQNRRATRAQKRLAKQQAREAAYAAAAARSSRSGYATYTNVRWQPEPALRYAESTNYRSGSYRNGSSGSGSQRVVSSSAPSSSPRISASSSSSSATPRNGGSGASAPRVGNGGSSSQPMRSTPQPPATSNGTGALASAKKPAPKPKSESPKKSSTEKPSGGEFDHLPFAMPVSGKSGYVTLPGKNSNLPEIDVRGIAPGTPVEIPDPSKPGSTIQFRVP